MRGSIPLSSAKTNNMKKKRTLNELRQTKEYKLSDQGGEYIIPYKGAEPQRQTDLNGDHGEIDSKLEECHQKLWGESYYNDPSEYDGDIHQEDLDKAAAEGSKEFFPEDRKDKRNAYHKQHIEPEITLNQQMQEISEIVVPTIHDVIFNEIIEVMDNYDELNWGYFVQDDAPTALLDACFDHKTEIHYEIFQLVLQKLK